MNTKLNLVEEFEELEKSGPSVIPAFTNSSTLPITLQVKFKDEFLSVEVINFHFKGASLKVKINDTRILIPGVSIDLFIGNKCIKNQMHFSISWQEISTTGCLGIQFTESLEKKFRIYERFKINELYPPTVSAQDPINPTRKIFFRVVDFSTTGMLLITSATNKNLFPGMSLDQCQLNIPGHETLKMSFYIENVRPTDTPNKIYLGVNIRNQNPKYHDVISQYAFTVSPSEVHSENRFEKMIDLGNFKSKTLKSGLSYKVIDCPLDYEKVLKLRHFGYAHAKKIRAVKTWQEMGEGLKNEGIILGAFLGGQLLASVEVRMGKNIPLRSLKDIPLEFAQSLDHKNILEPNRLVIHPKAQGSDIVVGMIQQIHSIAVINGNLDILLFATDQLYPFYNRMGAKKLGVQVPHPVLTSQKLNLMLLESETYRHGVGINPFFWSQIWEVTHKYFTEIGLDHPVPKTLSLKIRYLFGKFLWKKNELKKNKNKSSSSLKNVNPIFIDAKWTQKHLGAHVLLPYILQAEEMIGELKLKSILSKLGVPKEYFLKQSNWVSMLFFNQFIDEFKKIGNIEVLQRESGRKSMQKEMLGYVYYFIKHFANIETVFEKLGKVATRFNTTRTYEVLNIHSGHCTVKVGYYDKNLLPTDSSACLNWIGNFEGLVELITGKKGIVKKQACCVQGDPACVYIIEWQKKPILLKLLQKFFILSILVVSISYPFQLKTEEINFYSPYLAPIFFIIFGMNYLKNLFNYKRLQKQFERYNKESDDRYTDLQVSKSILDQNYKEARILEDISKDIQSSDRLTNILNTTTNAVCESFSFSRAFIMLVDQENKNLRTVSVSGASEYSSMLWNFSVNIEQIRENPMVLSSVYFSSQPILIADVNAHKFQLNSTSQELIQKLQTESFVIVPIPSIKNNWGVLVADKSSDKPKIDRRDLVTLQRLAQHLGIALDKKAKLEQEEKMRLIFQKYVPSRVVNGALTTEEPTLGGQIKNITCMFVDIRDFTKLSEAYPPEIILDILNRFFSVVQNLVVHYSGVIDKFLGDGVLVTWGTTSHHENHTVNAVHAAIELLEKIKILNQELHSMSLPSIHIGIGINSGQAIIGNIGSNSRMEFTAVGSTINVASRLENLCKTYNTPIVISESVMKKLNDTQLLQWNKIQGVQIRGIDLPISIGVFKK